MSTRADRLQALADTTKDYVQKEQKRINDEVAVLQAFLDGRTGGSGAQKSGVAKISAVAFNDLASFLKGD